MYYEIYVTLATITGILVFGLFLVTFYNYIRFSPHYDFYMLLLFTVISGPTVAGFIRSIILSLDSTALFELSRVVSVVLIIIAFVGFTITSYLVITIAKSAEIEFKIGNYMLLFPLLSFSFFSLYVIFFSQNLLFYEETPVYANTVAYDPIWSAFFVIFNSIMMAPFLIKGGKLIRIIKNRQSQIRAVVLVGFIVIKATKILIMCLFAIIWELVIVGNILEIISSAMALYIFIKHDFAESILMLLNVESVYITNSEGRTLHVTTFIIGRTKKMHDVLIGGIVKGTDGVVRQIRKVKHAGLSRIILNDRTVIIIEKSTTSGLYYIAFTKMYSRFLHEKILELRRTMDKMFGEKFEEFLEKISPYSVDQAMSKIFME